MAGSVWAKCVALPLIALLATGNAAPQLPPAPPAPAPSQPAQTPAPGLPAPDASSSSISYDRADRMLLDVTVNQQEPAIFIVDTGSERTIVSDALVERLGLPADGRATIASVAGRANVATARVSEIGFDKVSVGNLVAPVLKREHMGADGLIGVDSLQQKSVLFDFDKRQMQVPPSKRRVVSASNDPDEIVVTGRNRYGRLIFTNASIDGVKATVVIDSGAEYSIGNPALLARLAKRRKVRDPFTGTLHSVTGQSVNATVVKARRVEIGRLNLQDMPIAYTSAPAFTALELDEEPALLLGMNTMRAFRQIEVDFANRRVRFVTPGSTARPVLYARSAIGAQRHVAVNRPDQAPLETVRKFGEI